MKTTRTAAGTRSSCTHNHGNGEDRGYDVANLEETEARVLVLAGLPESGFDRRLKDPNAAAL
jgi:hypothetical protein